jgi:hypothetical protein
MRHADALERRIGALAAFTCSTAASSKRTSERRRRA